MKIESNKNPAILPTIVILKIKYILISDTGLNYPLGGDKNAVKKL